MGRAKLWGVLALLLPVPASAQLLPQVPSLPSLPGPVGGAVDGVRRALPVEETVRIRIHSDKLMAGSNVTVLSGSAAGEVQLRGLVKDRSQWSRAAQLAGETAGVEKVINEIAVPE